MTDKETAKTAPQLWKRRERIKEKMAELTTELKQIEEILLTELEGKQP